jgi:hypothetical protein
MMGIRKYSNIWHYILYDIICFNMDNDIIYIYIEYNITLHYITLQDILLYYIVLYYILYYIIYYIIFYIILYFILYYIYYIITYL